MSAISHAAEPPVRAVTAVAVFVLSLGALDFGLEQSIVRTVIANEVHAERSTGVLLLLARRVDGDVRTLLDWRGALAFGAAFGIVASLLRRGRGR